MRAMADELEAKNDLVQSIYVMVAATAGVSVLAGLVSFGAGFLAGAAATAAHILRAERVVTAVKAFLVASKVAMAGLKASRVGAFAVRFAGFAAQGTVATGPVKQVALDQDPFDLDNWSGADVLGVGAGGFTSAGLALRGAALAGTPARAFASGFAADAATSAGVDLVGGNATTGQVLTNAVVSGTASGALGRGVVRGENAGFSGRLPHGFGSQEEFLSFGRDLKTGLRAAGFADAQPVLQGSSVTGHSFGNDIPFDVGRVSDFDIAIASPSALFRAQSVGVQTRSSGVRTGPLTGAQLQRLGLGDLAHTLSRAPGGL